MKILFICNAAMQRSPTAAEIFSNKHKTACAGVYSEHRPITEKLLEWSDIIYVMEDHQRRFIGENFPKQYMQKRIVNLDIPDIFLRGQPELVKLLKEKVNN